uniref:K Homology domain-containing protein n=1 Tax=Glossina brevipalpis TaxID=37001 RepID=A0A1A9WHC7_9MUSC
MILIHLAMSDWEDDGEYDEKPQVSGFQNHSHDTSRRSGEHEKHRRMEKDRGGYNAYGRRFHFKESLYVRPESFGRIIGRAGSTIQGLQSDFNVRVDIDKSRGMVTVVGDNKGK